MSFFTVSFSRFAPLEVSLRRTPQNETLTTHGPLMDPKGLRRYLQGSYFKPQFAYYRLLLGTQNAEKVILKKEMVPDRFSKQSFKIQ